MIEIKTSQGWIVWEWTWLRWLSWERLTLYWAPLHVLGQLEELAHFVSIFVVDTGNRSCRMAHEALRCVKVATIYSTYKSIQQAKIHTVQHNTNYFQRQNCDHCEPCQCSFQGFVVAQRMWWRELRGEEEHGWYLMLWWKARDVFILLLLQLPFFS